ncbi:hypothetical protein [Bacteroides faecis]|uniref:hypothetical protein n=2 Tax=Bacteroides faecis TaxID=674529 RepID=UPI003DA5EC46
MKKIIYKGTIEESDYNRVKDIDSENYITSDGKTVLPKLTQMPLRDLAILSFTDENELKKYYTGNEEYFSYSVAELMLDTRVQARNLSTHRVSSFEDALYLLYNYSEEIPQADDPKYLSILIAADILNVEEEDIIEEARRDNKLYSDEDKNLFVPVRWIGDWYNDALAALGVLSVIYIQTRGTGKVKILIERNLE